MQLLAIISTDLLDVLHTGVLFFRNLCAGYSRSKSSDCSFLIDIANKGVGIHIQKFNPVFTTAAIANLIERSFWDGQEEKKEAKDSSR